MRAHSCRHCTGICTTRYRAYGSTERVTDDLQTLLSSHCPESTVLNAPQANGAGALLAEGSKLFLGRRSSEEPIYLDTLPSIGIGANRNGKPLWHLLIGEQDRYVVGARAHRLKPKGIRITLRADVQSLTLPFSLEVYPTAREIEERIEVRLEHDVPLQQWIDDLSP